MLASWLTEAHSTTPGTSTRTSPAWSPTPCRRSRLPAACVSSGACTRVRARSTSSPTRSPWNASAVSHQLRLLRHLGMVVGRRDGRRVVYDLHDDHVGELLEQAISHVEHLRAGLARGVVTRQFAEA